MDAKDTGQSFSGGLGGSTQELESIRSAARWLVGASAAILAVLLAGVQVNAISRIDELTLLRFLGSVPAVFLALGCTGAVLYLAARVLIPPGWTLTGLAHLASTKPQVWHRHWAYEELQGRRGLLTPTAELDLDKLYRHHRAMFVALVELRERGSTTLGSSLVGNPAGSTSYSVDVDGDEERLTQRLHLVEDITERITATVNLADVRRRYRRLIRSLPWLGVVTALSVAAFIWATAPATGAPITAPVRVEVHFIDDQRVLVGERIPVGCAGRTVAGVALGGTFEEPVVTSVGDAGCMLNQVRLRKGAAAVAPAPSTTK